MILSPVLKQRFFDANGVPLVGGKLYSYVAGTTTPLATFTDATGLTPNTNPVILDSTGSADVWIDPTLAYKFILEDAASVLQFSLDLVSGGGTSGSNLWSASSNYSMGSIVADSSGAGLLYVSLLDNNSGHPLSDVTWWRMFGGAMRTVTVNTTLLVTDELVRSNSTGGDLTHTLPACASTPIGKRISIKDVGTGGNTTSIKGNGSDLIDGSNTFSATLVQYEAVQVSNTGSAWDVI